MRKRYEVGLEKLATTESSVADMQQELIALQPQLEVSTKETEAAMVVSLPSPGHTLPARPPHKRSIRTLSSMLRDAWIRVWYSSSAEHGHPPGNLLLFTSRCSCGSKCSQDCVTAWIIHEVSPQALYLGVPLILFAFHQVCTMGAGDRHRE